MHLNGSTWKTYMGKNNEKGPSSETGEPSADPMNLTGAGGGGHRENFIFALRKNDRKFQTCDIELGHLSSCLPHLANISYRVGGVQLTFDGKKEKFVGDHASAANKLLSRNYRKPYVVPNNV